MCIIISVCQTHQGFLIIDTKIKMRKKNVDGDIARVLLLVVVFSVINLVSLVCHVFLYISVCYCDMWCVGFKTVDCFIRRCNYQRGVFSPVQLWLGSRLYINRVWLCDFIRDFICDFICDFLHCWSLLCSYIIGNILLIVCFSSVCVLCPTFCSVFFVVRWNQFMKSLWSATYHFGVDYCHTRKFFHVSMYRICPLRNWSTIVLLISKWIRRRNWMCDSLFCNLHMFYFLCVVKRNKKKCIHGSFQLEWKSISTFLFPTDMIQWIMYCGASKAQMIWNRLES